MTADTRCDAVASLLLDYVEIREIIGSLDWNSFVRGYDDFEPRNDRLAHPLRSCIERLRTVRSKAKAA
jgi:hypothetical protein